MSTNRGMAKKDVVHIYNSYSAIKKNETMSFAATWMHLAIITEKAIAPHSSTLAWKIPWTEEPGRLQSMGSLRVRHNWATSLSIFTFIHWRRKWQPAPVFLPGKSQGWWSLMGCRLRDRTDLGTTEATQQQQHGFETHPYCYVYQYLLFDFVECMHFGLFIHFPIDKFFQVHFSF